MNPITQARYLSTFSTTALARKLGVSRQYLSRLEQGIYDKPNRELLDWTVSTLNRNRPDGKRITPQVVEQLYKEWQWQRRESCAMDKSLIPCSLTEYDFISQPEVIYYHKVFKQWREIYWDSSHAFCVDMCLHPDPISKYEEGISLSMPKHLVATLTQLNLLGEGFKTSER